MLRPLKLAFLRVTQLTGLDALLLRSPWRRKRLLILGYHGISLEDEHRWSLLHIPPELFRQRMEALAKARCRVLPLGAALDALREDSLPERAVCITFDDGFYDFYVHAWPVLKEFGFPATLYLSTYYCTHEWPVFDPMCSYLLWKGRGRTLVWPEVLPQPAALDDRAFYHVSQDVFRYCRARNLTGAQKDALLDDLAARLGCDLASWRRRRILHLVNPREAAAMAAEGLDLQLHTHRHRVYQQPASFRREIDDNRAVLAGLTPRPAEHFCYPCGFTLEQFPAWLAGWGVKSAVTTIPGMATAASSPYRLPRLLDVPHLTGEEFRAWISGAACLIPRHTYPAALRVLDDGPWMEERNGTAAQP